MNIRKDDIFHEDDCKTFRERIDDYIIGKEIGKGAYAVVKQAVHRPTGTKVAIKIYDRFKLIDPARKLAIKREIQVMKPLDHPHIAKLIEVIEGPKQIYLVMEFVPGVSLLSYLKAMPMKRIEERLCQKIFLQIIDAVTYIHQKNTFHRDIKLENILIDERNYIKLIDFGFGAFSPRNKPLSFFCGTPSYMAPEIVMKKDYIGSSADIWSIGVLLYVLLCGSFPFRGLSEKDLYGKITKGVYSVPDHVSAKARSLLSRILIINPRNRLSSEEVWKRYSLYIIDYVA